MGKHRIPTTMETPVATVLRVVLVVHAVRTYSALIAAVPVLVRNVPRYQTNSTEVIHAVSASTVELRVKTARATASTSTVIAPATRTMNGHSGALTGASRWSAASADFATKAAACALMDIVEPVASCHLVTE